MGRKLEELKATRDIVLEILKTDKLARNSDSWLFLLVTKVYEDKLKINAANASLEDFLTNPIYQDFPCFESVRRARQKIQEERIDLASDKRIEKLRKEQEKEFEQFSREEF